MEKTLIDYEVDTFAQKDESKEYLEKERYAMELYSKDKEIRVVKESIKEILYEMQGNENMVEQIKMSIEKLEG